MKIWELVKQIEDAEGQNINELKEAITTMLVNFGEHGKCRKNLIRKDSSLTTMIIEAFTFYEEQIQDLQELVPK